ncbi:MAG TPA: phytase [Thermoplasmata archaeon]|nr:phytase [Thermoplasmata archaeon]
MERRRKTALAIGAVAAVIALLAAVVLAPGLFGITGPPGGPLGIPVGAFRGQYHDSEDLTNRTFERIDAAIDFDWGSGTPDPRLAPDTFSVRWEGQWDEASSGTYRFTIVTDDGMRIWVDGASGFDSWVPQSASTHTRDVALEAGRHLIHVEWFDRTGNAVARVSWAPAAGPPGGTVIVFPSVETGPSHHAGDTADDVAIWIHPSDPSLSLVIGDDKDGGLMVWDLDGMELQYVEGTNYNNVDLRYNVPLAGQFLGGTPHTTVALVGVGDELGSQIDFFKVDPGARRLEPAGSISTTIVPYGACMYHSPTNGKYDYFVNDQNGMNQQWELRDAGNGGVAGTLVREFDVGGITEGCVADDVLGAFYIGEEDLGIWKYGAEPVDGSARTQVDRTGSGGHLVADVEGLSIYYAGANAGYLLASSQGESRIAVYTREGSNAFLGEFTVGSNGTIDSTEGTDGLDVTNFPLGTRFPHGLLAVHDASNSGGSASNVKFVPWAAVASGLGLVVDTTWDPRSVGAAGAPPSMGPAGPGPVRPDETIDEPAPTNRWDARAASGRRE